MKTTSLSGISAEKATWLTSLEKVMVEQGVAIVAARKALVQQLLQVLEAKDFGVFPSVWLALDGQIEQ